MGDLITFDRLLDRPTDRPAERAHPAPEPLWREVVGRELRRRRLEAGRTLSDVAEAAGISTQYLSEVERGLKEPSSEILGAVHGALGLHLVDLTGAVTRHLERPAPARGPVALAV